MIIAAAQLTITAMIGRLLLILALTQVRGDTPDLHKNLGTCKWYNETLEPAYPCGAHGYALELGHHFCLRYEKLNDLLSPKGQQFVLKAKTCLQVELIKGLYDGISCDDLMTNAFATHVTCYSEDGYCDLGFRDIMAVFDIVGPILQYKFWSTIDTFAEIVGRCWFK